MLVGKRIIVMAGMIGAVCLTLIVLAILSARHVVRDPIIEANDSLAANRKQERRQPTRSDPDSPAGEHPTAYDPRLYDLTNEGSFSRRGQYDLFRMFGRLLNPDNHPSTPLQGVSFFSSGSLHGWRKDAFAKLNPEGQLLLEYKLGLLRRVEECLVGKVVSGGTFKMHFTFRVNANGDLGVGHDVEMIDSDALATQDPSVTECARRAHVGFEVRVIDGEGPREALMHWYDDITIPLAQDHVYEWFASDE